MRRKSEESVRHIRQVMEAFEAGHLTAEDTQAELDILRHREEVLSEENARQEKALNLLKSVAAKLPGNERRKDRSMK